MWKVFVLASFLLINSQQDCSGYTSRATCRGKLHDGDACYWKAESPQECVEGKMNDQDKMCGEIGDCPTCTGPCAWDEGKCQDRLDVEDPFSCPTSNSGNSGNSGSSGSSTSSSGSSSSSSTTTSGSSSSTNSSTSSSDSSTSSSDSSTSTSGSSTSSSGSSTSSSDSSSGSSTSSSGTSSDSSSSSGSSASASASNAHPGKKCEEIFDPVECKTFSTYCFWDYEGEGGECEDLETVEQDCESFTQEMCSQVSDLGAKCHWDVNDLKCEKNEDFNVAIPPNDDLCKGVALANCNGYCVWDQGDDKCVHQAEVGILRKPQQEADCGDYTVSGRGACSGKTHEGKQCFWHAEKIECVEGTAGDPEKVCGEIGAATECNAMLNNMCCFDEGKCIQAGDGNCVAGTSTGTTAGSSSSASAGSSSSSATAGTSTGSASAGTSGGSASAGSASAGSETSASSVNSDCEVWYSIGDCTGKTHDGEKCFWDAPNMKCEKCEVDDVDCFCRRWLKKGECNADTSCRFDENEFKCMHTSEMEEVEQDCATYTVPEDCNGKVHQFEREVCYWHVNQGKCEGGQPNDPGHICAQYSKADLCAGNEDNMCGWNSEEYKCVQKGDMSNVAAAGVDCEEHSTKEVCTGKTHEAQQCYWRAMNFKCEGGQPNDPEHFCEQYTRSECVLDQLPANSPSCAWDESECKHTVDIEQEGNAGNAGNILDCESYTAAGKEECKKHTHEGKQCFWHSEVGECEEGERGDPEKLCGENATMEGCIAMSSTDLNASADCFWDQEEFKCIEFSSLVLRSESFCGALSTQNACFASKKCEWLNEGCLSKRYLGNAHVQVDYAMWIFIGIVTLVIFTAVAMIISKCTDSHKPSKIDLDRLIPIEV